MTGDEIWCEGKKVFETFYQAQRSAHKLNRRRDKAKTGAYKCPGTHHFHVGNTMGNKHRRKAQTMKGIERYGRTRFSN